MRGSVEGLCSGSFIFEFLSRLVLHYGHTILSLH